MNAGRWEPGEILCILSLCACVVVSVCVYVCMCAFECVLYLTSCVCVSLCLGVFVYSFFVLHGDKVRI